jgi:omega-6 fatty acid desaturase (delta-12 desaturase)
MIEAGTEKQGYERSEGGKPWWRETLEPYAQPRIGRSVVDVLTSLVPYVALFVAMYFALDASYWLTLALSIPAAGFALRSYIVFHDCAHGSFLPSKRANAWLGKTTGLMLFHAFYPWRHSHAVHHASAGDLDRRGVGDLPTMTVAEYRSSSLGKRIGYRLFRNPMIMFTLGPIFSMVVQPRLWSSDMRPRIKRSVIYTNIAVAAMVAVLCFVMGPVEYLLVQAPILFLAGGMGVWLFYVQHQFEDVYWENTDSWSYAEAALQGSSYLKLPKVLQFFTGNIGLHHVHHLSARIPNYNLQRAHDENPVFHDVPTLTLWDGLKTTRLKLIDEESGRLVTWREARRGPTEKHAEPAPAAA